MHEHIFDVLSAHQKRRPQQLAIGDDHLSINYGDLLARINDFSRLIDGGESQSVVAVAVPPSTAAAICALGALRAGAVWLHIDPLDPIATIEKTLKHAKCDTLICLDVDCSRFAEVDVRRRISVSYDKVPTANGGAPATEVAASEPADLYYTSGSTGEPKGVWKSHASVFASARARTEVDRLRPTDRLGMLGSWSYSFVRNTLYAGLIAGCRIRVQSHEESRLLTLARWLVENEITVTAMVPSVARTLAASDERCHDSLRLIVLAGEPSTVDDIRSLFAYLPPACEIINQYGSAESGYIGMVRLNQVPTKGELTRFTPLTNHRFEILDKDAAGIGRLRVTGSNVSGGYWRDSNRTSERFSADATSAGRNTFLSDDLVRLTADDRYELIGRVDSRVKIRGSNVYLNEVEAFINRIDGVRQSKVLLNARRDNRSLIAYIHDPDRSVVPTQIRSAMHKHLSPSQIPADIVVLPEFPLTRRGKVDSVALSKLSPITETIEEAPIGGLECFIAGIWQEVLGLDAIDRNSHFIELGGDSLRAVELVNRISKALGLTNPEILLTQGASVASMAQLIDTCDVDQRALVTLQSDGDQTPLCLVHGGGGDIFSFAALAWCLPKDREILAFHRVREGFAPVEELAAEYVEELRQRNPAGPYVIGGYSFGGVVAFAMGQQLVAQGAEVHLLMLDVPVKATLPWVSWYQRLILGRSNGRSSVGGSGQFSLTRRAWATLSRVYPTYLKSHIQYRRYRRRREAVPESVRRDRFMSLSHLSGLGFSVTDYPANITLFRASEFNSYRPLDLGWLRLIPPDRLRVVSVPGTHLSMLQRPNVFTFAEKLHDVLVEIDAKRSRSVSNVSTETNVATRRIRL